MNHKFVKKAIEAWQEDPKRAIKCPCRFYHKKTLCAFWDGKWILKCPDCSFVMLVPNKIIKEHLNKFTELFKES